MYHPTLRLRSWVLSLLLAAPNLGLPTGSQIDERGWTQTITYGTVPPLTYCEPAHITWTGGIPPYAFQVMVYFFIEDYTIDYPTAAFNNIETNSFEWIPSIDLRLRDIQSLQPNGVVLELWDGTGNLVGSQVFDNNVQLGSNTSCLTGSEIATVPSGTSTGGASDTSTATGYTPSQTPPSSPSNTGSTSGSAMPTTNIAGSQSGGGSQTDTGTIVGAIVGGIFAVLAAILGAWLGPKCMKRAPAPDNFRLQGREAVQAPLVAKGWSRHDDLVY